jgi:DNA-binding response OmpR family regulator
MSAASLTRVIYVDDEPHIRALVQISLEKVGKFETLICESGDDAVALVPEFRPDLILLDVMMPGMDGPGTLAALRELPSLDRVPVVFLTAKANPAERQRLVELGAVDVITKPFPPLELPDRIRAIWSRAMANDAPGGTAASAQAA